MASYGIYFLSVSYTHQTPLPQPKGGVLLPDQATIYLSAIEDRDYKNEKVNWWDNVRSIAYL